MIIQYASDLHLEFIENKQYLHRNPLKPIGEILILAGDIVPLGLIDKHKDFFKYLSDNFSATYWLPGNHEYYNFDIATKTFMIHEKIRSNVSLINNKSIFAGEVKLVFSTLWSYISPANQWQIERGMNDFYMIKNGKYRYSVEKYNELHAESLTFLNKELLNSPSNKTVVATHHVPTLKNYPEKYKNTILNPAFAVELFDLITNSQPDCWMYGHSHVNTPDFKIDKTNLVCNQLGYVSYGENKEFCVDKTFSL